MNNLYNTPPTAQKPKTRLPAWFWVMTVVGLIIAVLAGYFSGSNFGSMVSLLNIEDTNGEDTALCSLDFKDFLGVYDGYSGYNLYDSDAVCIMYDTSRDYDAQSETYNNRFTGAYTEQNATFIYLNYYDVCFVSELSLSKAVTVAFSSKLSTGNLEGRLIHVASDFKVELDEFDTPIIKDEYITTLASFGANELLEKTVNVPANGILMFVVAAEGAVGSYHLKIS